MVVFFISPGINKKTKINAHELEALRFILRFLLTVTNTQRTHTSAGESRMLRLAACLHPRALRASTPGSSARGRAQRQRTSRFLGADSHSKVRDLLQTGARCAVRTQACHTSVLQPDSVSPSQRMITMLFNASLRAKYFGDKTETRGLLSLNPVAPCFHSPCS